MVRISSDEHLSILVGTVNSIVCLYMYVKLTHIVLGIGPLQCESDLTQDHPPSLQVGHRSKGGLRG